jgi:hypothetical protein
MQSIKHCGWACCDSGVVRAPRHCHNRAFVGLLCIHKYILLGFVVYNQHKANGRESVPKKDKGFVFMSLL